MDVKNYYDKVLENMDLKNDILNVELDLSSYFENLSFENIPNTSDVSDETIENDIHSDIENAVLPIEVNEHQAEANYCKECENSSLETMFPHEKYCINKYEKTSMGELEGQKDINGNEKSPVDDLNNLIEKLELSDLKYKETEKSKLKIQMPDQIYTQISEDRKLDTFDRNYIDESQCSIKEQISEVSHIEFNDYLSESSDSEIEETTEKSELRKRGPVRNRRQNRRNDHDKSQFLDHRLRFWSGASHVECNDSRPQPNLFYEFQSGTNFGEHRNVLSENSNNNLFNPDCGLIFPHHSTIQNETAIAATSTFYENFAVSSSVSNIDTQSRPVEQLHFTPFNEDIHSYSAITIPTHKRSTYPICSQKDISEDSCVGTVNSPESGYDTSTSPSGSPPPSCLDTTSLELIPENIYEQEILNNIIEIESYANCLSKTSNILSASLDDEVNKKKEIVEYLKNNQVEQSETYNVNKEFVPTDLREMSNISIQNFVTEPFKSTCVTPNVNVGSLQTELNDFYPSSVDEWCSQDENELLQAHFKESVQTDLNESYLVSSDINKECLPTEVSILPSESLSNERNKLDLRNEPQVVSTPVLNQSSQNNFGTRIACRPLNDKAKRAFRDSLHCDEFHAAQAKIYRKINEDKQCEREIKVIYIEEEDEKSSENRTNLHRAVLNSEIAEIYCLVEIYKQTVGSGFRFSDLNLRDRYRKTALDYAIEKNLTLVINYLKENNVCQSPHV